MKILWLDTETTGLNSQNDKIIQLSCIYEDTAKNITLEKDWYIKHNSYPESFAEAEKIHGITKEFLEESGKIELEVYAEFISFLDNYINKFDKKDKAFLAGYNVNFDKGFLVNLFLSKNNSFFNSYFHSPMLDVMSQFAFYLLDEQCTPKEELSNYKLETLCKYFGIELKAHNSMEDIRATRILSNILIENSRRVK